jgi:hypothetical protein
MILRLFGFDTAILRECDLKQQRYHRVLASMLLVNMFVFAFGVYHFFQIPINNAYFLWFTVIFLTCIYLAFNRMILATHDHDLSYFNQHSKMSNFEHGSSVIIRLFIVFIFSLLCGCGIIFWGTTTLFYGVLEGIKTGQFDHQPALLNYLGIMDYEYDSIDNITDRFKVLHLVFGIFYPFMLFIPFLLTSFVMLLPFVMKFYLPELSNGEYEYQETKKEHLLILSDYELTWNYIDYVRKTEYKLPRYRYETHEDPPYNTKKREKPLDITY